MSSAPHPTRILLLSDHASTGGTRDYTGRLLDFYASKGWEVTLLCAHPQGRDLRLPPGARVTQITAADVLGDRALAGPWALCCRRREAEAFGRFIAAGGYHLLVASVGHPGLFLPAAQAPIPSIYLLHTYPHGRRAQLLGRWWFRGATAGVDRLVTVSEASRRALIRLWGTPDDQVVAVHSTVGQVPAPSADPLPRDTVLTLGHVEPYKGPDAFVAMAQELAERFPAVRFVWAGEGSQLEQYRELVRARGLDARVEFVGHVVDTDALYARALVYVQPSRVESLGLALLDASRHGVPSVVPDVGGMPEVVAPGTGFVVPDAVGLAGAVARLLDDEGLRTACGTAARTHYEQEFSESRWIERMESLHTELLRQPAS